MAPDGRKRQKANAMKEIIHSGHFMVSDIDDSEIQEGEDGPSLVVHESDCDQETLPLPPTGFDFESACKETSKTYTFGSRSTHSISIDASLTKLFECMTLAYSGKLTSPRWKQFKGLKLRLKEKIRLNNMIWRAWHMQFVMRIQTDKLCQFATPLDGDTHMKPEAVVIEGTYWKRRMANITAEYQKWRLFYRQRSRPRHSGPGPAPASASPPDRRSSHPGLAGGDGDARWWPKGEPFCSPLQSALDEDFLMDFSDTLFSSLNAAPPFDFPNPREIAAKAGIADFIQPGLVQLQPSVDDFMDTLEPLSDLFSDFLNSKLPTLAEEAPPFGAGETPPAYPQDAFGNAKPAVHVFSPAPVRTSGVEGGSRRKCAAPRPQQPFPPAPPAAASPLAEGAGLATPPLRCEAPPLRLKSEPFPGQGQAVPYLPREGFPPLAEPPVPLEPIPRPDAKPLFFPAGPAEREEPFRRHSYATGQEYAGARRSRAIAPALPGGFVVPEVPARGGAGRTRSRSVSSPQAGSPRAAPPARGSVPQAVSLTDVSAREPALLAQLLSSSGCGGPELGRAAVLKVGGGGGPLAILRPLHTFVFSPLQTTTAAATTAVDAGDLQRSLLPDPRTPPARGAPDSPGSSTCSSSPAVPALSFEASPPPAKGGPRPRSDEERVQYREHRRVCHINAEQKRRCNIKSGFEALHGLLPPAGPAPPAKISKAAMLQRGAEYIRALRAERQQQLEEAEKLRQQIDELNQAISAFQSLLPASGAPVPRQRAASKMRELFEEYVRRETLRNWKFWIFSLIVEPLVESFGAGVSTASLDEMGGSLLAWLDAHCSLVALRPGVLNSLRLLSTTTNILSDPSRMPEEATRAVTKREPASRR